MVRGRRGDRRGRREQDVAALDTGAHVPISGVAEARGGEVRHANQVLPPTLIPRSNATDDDINADGVRVGLDFHGSTAATALISTSAPGTPSPATRAAVTRAGSSDASSDAIAP